MPKAGETVVYAWLDDEWGGFAIGIVNASPRKISVQEGAEAMEVGDSEGTAQDHEISLRSYVPRGYVEDPDLASDPRKFANGNFKRELRQGDLSQLTMAVSLSNIVLTMCNAITPQHQIAMWPDGGKITTAISTKTNAEVRGVLQFACPHFKCTAYARTALACDVCARAYRAIACEKE